MKVPWKSFVLSLNLIFCFGWVWLVLLWCELLVRWSKFKSNISGNPMRVTNRVLFYEKVIVCDMLSNGDIIYG